MRACVYMYGRVHDSHAFVNPTDLYESDISAHFKSCRVVANVDLLILLVETEPTDD